MAVLDWSRCPVVERVPGKMSCAWVLKDTRMPVATIFENLEAGASIDDVLAWYEGLDRKQVQAVIEFACPEQRAGRHRALMRVLLDRGRPSP